MKTKAKELDQINEIGKLNEIYDPGQDPVLEEEKMLKYYLLEQMTTLDYRL